MFTHSLLLCVFDVLFVCVLAACTAPSHEDGVSACDDVQQMVGVRRVTDGPCRCDVRSEIADFWIQICSAWVSVR